MCGVLLGPTAPHALPAVHCGRTAPPVRRAQVGHKLHVFGGGDVTLDPRAELYVFDTHTLAWSNPGAAGTAPSARSYHAMALMEESIFLFGGSDAQSQPLGDLHVLATDALRWTQPSMLGTVPSARKGHTFTKSGAYLYLFGGKGAGGVLLNDVHELDTNRVSWRALQTTGELPPGRDGHTATAVEDRMYVFGGASSQGKLNDVRVLDLHTLRWSRPRSVGGPPGPRWGHSATLISQQIYMFGGVDQEQQVAATPARKSPCRAAGFAARAIGPHLTRRLACPCQVLSDIWAMARHCQGPLMLTSSRDSFSSGDGLYQANANCSWHMAPTEPNRQARHLPAPRTSHRRPGWPAPPPPARNPPPPLPRARWRSSSPALRSNRTKIGFACTTAAPPWSLSTRSPVPTCPARC